VRIRVTLARVWSLVCWVGFISWPEKSERPVFVFFVDLANDGLRRFLPLALQKHFSIPPVISIRFHGLKDTSNQGPGASAEGAAILFPMFEACRFPESRAKASGSQGDLLRPLRLDPRKSLIFC
jgi:hypothetical protein